MKRTTVLIALVLLTLAGASPAGAQLPTTDAPLADEVQIAELEATVHEVGAYLAAVEREQIVAYVAAVHAATDRRVPAYALHATAEGTGSFAVILRRWLASGRVGRHRVGCDRRVRVGWQLVDQHRERLLRRAPVPHVDVARCRRWAVRTPRRPRHPRTADRGGLDARARPLAGVRSPRLKPAGGVTGP